MKLVKYYRVDRTNKIRGTVTIRPDQARRLMDELRDGERLFKKLPKMLKQERQ